MDKQINNMLISTEKQIGEVIKVMFKTNQFNRLDIIEKTDAVAIYNMDLSIDEISDIVEVLDDMIIDVVSETSEYKQVLEIIEKDRGLDIDFNPDIFIDLLELFEITAEDLVGIFIDGTLDIIVDNKQLLKVSIDTKSFSTLKHVVVLDLKKLQGEETLSKCLINEDRTIMHYSYGLTFVRKK